MSGEEPRTLNRWLIKKVQGHRIDSLRAEPAIDPQARVLFPWEIPTATQNELESNWRSYISERADRYIEINEPFGLFSQVDEGSYMYACSAVHCTEDREMYVNLISYFPSPVRVWINGQLVITGHSAYINRELYLRVPFREGFNIILVESPLHLDRQMNEREFIIKISPLERLTKKQKQTELIDPEWLEQLKYHYHLVVDTYAVSRNEAGIPLLEGMVQPQCFLPESVNQTLVLQVLDRYGVCIAEQIVEPTQPFHLLFPNEAQGFYRIKVTDKHDDRTVVITHCCVGSIEEEAARLSEQISQRTDSNSAVLDILHRFAEVPAVMRSLNQFVPADWMQQNLKAFYEASIYAASAMKDEPVDLTDVFPERYSVVLPKSVDTEEVIYTVHLPESFDRNRNYPILFYFHDAQGRKFPTPLPWMQWSRTSEAIVVDLVGISRNHYADDIQVVRTINQIVESLPADRDRLYGVGFCTGAPKTYRIAFLVPHLFAGFASIIGDARIDAHQPEYAYFDNLQHTAVFAVCGVENWFFNSMRKSDFIGRLPLGETWMIHGFIHNESNTLFNSKKLLEKMLKVKRNPLPASVNYTLIDPSLNHSYWVDAIQSAKHAEKRTQLHTEIRSSQEITVHSENVSHFRLLLAEQEMELDQKITLVLNGVPYPLRLSDPYIAVSCTCEGVDDSAKEHWDITLQGLQQAAFTDALNRIGDDDEQLGIKKVYVNNPIIVKPNRKNDPRRSFHMRLSFLLQNPIRDRYIAYKLDACTAQQWADRHVRSRAFIHLLDVSHLHEDHKQLLKQLDISVSADALTYGNETYRGEYAAVIYKQLDSTDHLLVAYQGDSAGEALLALWNTFDDNPMFYEQAIVWHDGKLIVPKRLESSMVV